MSKPESFKLNDYIKAVEELARRQKLTVRHHEGRKGSAYTFKVFLRATDEIPDRFWQVHTGHNRKREIWSKEDYKKASLNLGGTHEDFMTILENI